jgi:hypothetical protein
MKKDNIDKLLNFQKSLSEQFSIAEDKILRNIDINNEDKLAIGFFYNNLNVLILLEDLKFISGEIRYEQIIRTKPWILGYNQDKGDIYTIYDLKNALALLVGNISEKENDSKIVENKMAYLQDFNENKQAFLCHIDNESLKSTSDYLLFYDENNINEDLSLEKFFKKENITSFEWECLLEIAKKEKKVVENNLVKFSSKVYVDEKIGKPIFVINMNKFTEFLINSSPF